MHHKETLHYEDVEVGMEIPAFVHTTALMEWNRFAGANEEYVMIHMDDDAGKAAGQSGVFGMGNLRFAYFHNMLMRWVGRDGVIKKVGCQYRGLNLKGDTMTCSGKVTAKYERDGEHLVELELAATNQRGENTAPGTAVVALPSRGR